MNVQAAETGSVEEAIFDAAYKHDALVPSEESALDALIDVFMEAAGWIASAS